MEHVETEMGKGLESPSYKIRAFYHEDQASFAPFYRMADALIVAIRMTNLYMVTGMDSELLKNLVKSVRTLTPTGPFQESIAAEYIQSVLNICNEAEVLATHFYMDQTRVPPKLDQWTEDALAKTVRLCEHNNSILKNYFLENESPHLDLQKAIPGSGKLQHKQRSK